MDTGRERAETVGRRRTWTRPRSPLTLLRASATPRERRQARGTAALRVRPRTPRVLQASVGRLGGPPPDSLLSSPIGARFPPAPPRVRHQGRCGGESILVPPDRSPGSAPPPPPPTP